MKKWETNNGAIIYLLLGGRSNVYLVVWNGINILVDTAKKSSRQHLLDVIEGLPRSHRRVDYLVLTHTHYDHCRNAAYLKGQKHCRIIMSAFEKKSAEDGFTVLPKGTNAFSARISLLGNFLGSKCFGYENFSPDIVLTENYTFPTSGNQLKIIATPGHSKGSLSLIVSDYVLVGDALFGIFKESVFPPFADNVPQLIQSWKKLLATDSKVFLPGHGQAVSRERLERAVKRFSKRYPAFSGHDCI